MSLERATRIQELLMKGFSKMQSPAPSHIGMRILNNIWWYLRKSNYDSNSAQVIANLAFNKELWPDEIIDQFRSLPYGGFPPPSPATHIFFAEAQQNDNDN